MGAIGGSVLEGVGAFPGMIVMGGLGAAGGVFTGAEIALACHYFGVY